MKNLFLLVSILIFNYLMLPGQPTDLENQPYVIENYYRVKWGHQQEFIDLYKKNHYPIVEKMMDNGYITEVVAEKSPFHGTETDRWDFRIRLVFKDLESAFVQEPWNEISESLYPDQEKLKIEEQKRFELLLAHWDVILTEVPLNE